MAHARGSGEGEHEGTRSQRPAAVVEEAARPGEATRPGRVVFRKIEKPPGMGASGFFDPEDPGAPYVVVLRRLFEDGRETFALGHPIGYWDAEVGGVIVPEDTEGFRTDLTSVPDLLTWLIPVTGLHLPAALVHDGLVHRPDECPSYIAERAIDRVTADRVFRSAMGDLGLTTFRRWLIWAGVATATMTTGPLGKVWRAWVALVATLIVVVAGGALATLDLFDCRAPIPWMGDRPLGAEVLYGAIGALLVPLVPAALWGRRWLAGVVAGVALALLLHVTIAVALVYATVNTLDALVERDLPSALRWGGPVVGALAVLVALGTWACT